MNKILFFLAICFIVVITVDAVQYEETDTMELAMEQAETQTADDVLTADYSSTTEANAGPCGPCIQGWRRCECGTTTCVEMCDPYDPNDPKPDQ